MVRMQEVLIYGAYGYTGRLITEEAVNQGILPLLSGRNGPELKRMAEEFGLEYVTVTLDDRQALREVLKKVKLIIHCAGPFIHTAEHVASACLETGTHYMDITGEYAVFDLLHKMDGKAKDAKIMLLPGAGFDVVPSDCLANQLKDLLSEADALTLAFTSKRASVSRGTAKTMVENAGQGHLIRKDGKLVNMPSGKVVRLINYGPFKQMSVGISWGDISTAWHSTGIPNILVLTGSDVKQIRSLKMAQRLRFLLKLRLVKNFIKRQIDKKPPGPTAEKRSTSDMYLWGKAKAGDKTVERRLKTPNGYTLTARAVVLITKKILRGEFSTGYQTPATAYGKDLIFEIEGCQSV